MTNPNTTDEILQMLDILEDQNKRLEDVEEKVIELFELIKDEDDRIEKVEAVAGTNATLEQLAADVVWTYDEQGHMRSAHLEQAIEALREYFRGPDGTMHVLPRRPR
jgi:hypothetical protein